MTIKQLTQEARKITLSGDKAFDTVNIVFGGAGFVVAIICLLAGLSYL